jgi:TolA-binding protein
MLPSCAWWYPQKDGERLHSEVYSLQTQLTTLRRKLEESEQDRRQKGEQLAVLASEVGRLSSTALRASAELGGDVDKVREDIGRLKGTSESLGERISAIEVSSSRLQDEIELRIEERVRLALTRRDEEKQRALEEARERLLGDPAALFAEAARLVKAGAPGDARSLVRELMRRRKGDQAFSSGHAAHAQYLVGETYFAEGNFEQSLAEHGALTKTFPGSAWEAKAMLRMGESFERLDMPSDARVFYTKIVETHPRTPQAAEARARLEALRSASGRQGR